MRGTEGGKTKRDIRVGVMKGANGGKIKRGGEWSTNHGRSRRSCMMEEIQGVDC